MSIEGDDADGTTEQRLGPLAGMRVIDLGTMLAGPITCQILGDFGAEVLKVEHPQLGDTLRHHGHSKDGIGLWYKTVGRNKRTITLDLSHHEGAEILLELARTADVIVENFRPGTLERWGLGYDRLRAANERVVLVRLSGFGQSGPYASRPAYGTVIECMSGWSHMTGQGDGPPTLPPYGLADNVAGLVGAIAACVALVGRDRSGAGQVADVSLLQSLMGTLAPLPVAFDQLGLVERRSSNGGQAPRGIFPTRDGRYVGISAASNKTARRVMELIGRLDIADQSWYQGGDQRALHEQEINGAIAAWTREHDRDDIVARATSLGVPLGPVNDVADIAADEHVREVGMLATVDDEELGAVVMNNVLFRLSATPGSIRFTGRSQGADTHDVLVGELGIDEERLARLHEEGIV